MLHPKLLIFTTLNVFAVSFLVAYLEIDLTPAALRKLDFRKLDFAQIKAKLVEFRAKLPFLRGSTSASDDSTPATSGKEEGTKAKKKESTSTRKSATKPEKSGKSSAKHRKSDPVEEEPPKGEEPDGDATPDPSQKDPDTESPEPKKKQKETSAKTILTREELAKYDGKKGSKGLYLAILGKVFDVSKGKKHYGPGGGYHFFVGKDASRAFVSGDFTEAGLHDDLTGLSHQDMLGIEDWVSFYEKDYTFVGYLEGTFYDSNGEPTEALRKAEASLAEAKEKKNSDQEEQKRFPSCNSEWSQGAGGRVWCTDKSGGITRDWVGVPRKLFKPGSTSSRCACIKNYGPPSDATEGASHKNRGDLDHPGLKEYTGCSPSAVSCPVKES